MIVLGNGHCTARKYCPTGICCRVFDSSPANRGLAAWQRMWTCGSVMLCSAGGIATSADWINSSERLSRSADTAIVANFDVGTTSISRGPVRHAFPESHLSAVSSDQTIGKTTLDIEGINSCHFTRWFTKQQNCPVTFHYTRHSAKLSIFLEKQTNRHKQNEASLIETDGQGQQ